MTEIVLEAFHLDPTAESVFRAIAEQPGSSAARVTEDLGLSKSEASAVLEELLRATLLRPSWEHPGELRPVSPEIALRTLLSRQEAELAKRQAEVAELRAFATLSTMDIARDQAHGGEQIERLDGLDATRDRLEALAHETRDEVLAMMPGGGQSKANMDASKALDEDLLERGARVLTLYLDSVHNDTTTAGYAHWLIELGGEVRTVPTLPIRTVVFDRTAALVPIDPEDSSLGALLVRSRSIVQALAALFDQLWAAAQPFGNPLRRSVDGLTGQERDLLRLLAMGRTDTMAARGLGVSARTARRIIAGVMNRVGARSRFQAGACVAERGWIAPVHQLPGTG